jgi:hypothetical protein
VWDIAENPLILRIAERALQPLVGKSLVVYARKPPAATVAPHRSSTGPARFLTPETPHAAA